MKRGLQGSFETISTVGETVRAFVPAPLPPCPALAMDGALQNKMERAVFALGRLDGMTNLLPDPAIFLYMFIRKEAVLSSMIEGTQSSLSDLLLFEADGAPGVPVCDVQAVSSYVHAIEYGMERIAGGFPLSLRLLKEIHAVLLEHGRGSGKNPGEFRRSQNWIGGTRPGNAAFVPPPPEKMNEAICQLELFLHQSEMPVLIKAALGHLQFETIHPFLDGNGRIGRLMISLLLCNAGILHQPLLYLSYYFKKHRAAYYELLNSTRENGDWERWLDFFFDAVAETATQSCTIIQQLNRQMEMDRAAIARIGKARTTVLAVHQAMLRHPIADIRKIRDLTGFSIATVGSAVRRLCELSILEEMTKNKRNRLFCYRKYLKTLTPGEF
ncbi:MAG: Fic family protein [Victivallaceae bacterium]|nr:Fic family protein [Victivallaceae bacterium]